ncbi:hypothetical protein [Vibrio salinus]|uniref:hypothetical protein n=1 Tax=Vibrio salinus TaxID=2899784 RepID=UPI001E3C51BF|nr:hypothetical protein [Vibrio salinus]MCE0495439.1 hypothetical protein [Vibrio salinus]
MIKKYAGISCYGSFLVAAILSYLPVEGWFEMVLKTLVLLFVLHMIVYSFVVAVSAKRTRNKVLLVLFAVLFPAGSGFVLYYCKGSKEGKVITDTSNS